jgi:hypothetical protein
MKHPGSTIERAAPDAKPRDNLNGDFAGDKNDPNHGTNVKSRKLDEHDIAEGKIPKK